MEIVSDVRIWNVESVIKTPLKCASNAWKGQTSLMVCVMGVEHIVLIVHKINVLHAKMDITLMIMVSASPADQDAYNVQMAKLVIPVLVDFT